MGIVRTAKPFALLGALVLVAASMAGCTDATSKGSQTQEVDPNSYTFADYKEPKLLKTEKLSIWPEAATVRLFVEDIPFDKPGRPDHGMSNPAGVVLTKTQQSLVSNAVTRKTYTDYPAVAACFIPHHFFRFYDARGRQLGELQVCYCCGGIRLNGSPHGLANKQVWGFDYDGVKEMMAKMGISSEVQC